ncbi:unnamed protein product [Laminaria digitata]
MVVPMCPSGSTPDRTRTTLRQQRRKRRTSRRVSCWKSRFKFTGNMSNTLYR